MLNVNGFPRRGRLECLDGSETAIREAVRAVERMGADPLLTEAVTLLGRAQEKLADYIDGCELGRLLSRNYVANKCGCGRPAPDATGYCDDCFGG